MQVHTVTTRYADSTPLGKHGDALHPIAGTNAGSAEVQLGSAVGNASAWAEILGKYDVRDITPTELSQMVQKLYDAGVISEDDLEQLTAIRHDLDTSGIDPDESIDLLQYYVDRIKQQQRHYDPAEGAAAESKQLAPLLRRLDWVEKFALIQAAPELVGFGTVT